MDTYIGQIIMTAFDFAPYGWAFCDGQLLPIDQYQALFVLLGTQYGGDGKTSFALPNLQGRVPLGQGQSTGTSQYPIGQSGGAESVTLPTAKVEQQGHKDTVSTAAPGSVSVVQPYLCVNFIIALQGTFPSRS